MNDRLFLREGPAVLVSDEQAAKLLGVSAETLDAFARRGLLPAVRIGGTAFYAPERLEAFAALLAFGARTETLRRSVDEFRAAEGKGERVAFETKWKGVRAVVADVLGRLPEAAERFPVRLDAFAAALADLASHCTKGGGA